MEFTDVLFLLQLRLSLNPRAGGDPVTLIGPQGEKSSSRFLKITSRALNSVPGSYPGAPSKKKKKKKSFEFSTTLGNRDLRSNESRA